MAHVTWGFANDILSQFDRVQRELNDARLGHRRAGSNAWTPDASSTVYPPLNVYDNGEGYVVRAEVPGIDPKSLDVQVAGGTLSIRGERKQAQDSSGNSYHRRERDFGEFSRSLTLPKKVDNSKTMASLVDGVLELHLPYAEETKPRKITVRAN